MWQISRDSLRLNKHKCCKTANNSIGNSVVLYRLHGVWQKQRYNYRGGRLIRKFCDNV